MKTKLLLIIAIMSMTLTFAQKKQADQVLNDSKQGVSTVYNDGKSVVQTIYSDAKKLSPKVEQAVSSLAQSLKTTSENLWVILVKQQKVWSIGFLILTLTSLINWCLFYKRYLNNKQKEEDFIKGKEDVIGQVLNPNYDKYYADRNEYKNDLRAKQTIEGKVGERDILLKMENSNNKWFKPLHLIICLCLSGLSIWHFGDMLTGFINPEYGALKTIVQVASILK